MVKEKTKEWTVLNMAENGGTPIQWCYTTPYIMSKGLPMVIWHQETNGLYDDGAANCTGNHYTNPSES